MEPNDILSRINHDSGMTVPDGYFADFRNKMAAELPPIDFEKGTDRIMPRSLWQKVRPYTYMAAMFAGIWCTMKVFNIMRPSADLSLDNSPVATAAISNDEFFNHYIAPTVDDIEILDELYDEGFDTDDFDNI